MSRAIISSRRECEGSVAEPVQPFEEQYLESHPPLRGLKTESELKIARIETQFPEGPQGFFGAWVKTQWACFRLEWLGRAACSRSAGPVSDSDIPLRSCQHHQSEIAPSRHSTKALLAQQTYL